MYQNEKKPRNESSTSQSRVSLSCDIGEKSDAQVKYWEISNSEGTFIIKKFAVSALWVEIEKTLKIRAKMNEQMSVCLF